MSGPIGYVLGYDAGRSDAEISRQRREIVDRIFYGTRHVEVDQSYINRLHVALAAANASSDHNYDAADRFRDEAFEWKAYAQSQENLVAPLKAQITALQAQLAERDAAVHRAQVAIAEERAVHQTTYEEKWGLNLFRLIATWLIEAHSAGRSDRPEFAEMRDMAKDVTDAIQRGEPFRGYRDEPQKKARLQALLEELLRP